MTKTITDYPANDNDAFNIQAGIDYRPDNVSTINFAIARKTRFATSKDRYSYRLGTAIPNPDLTAEFSVNYELGYKGLIASKLHVEAALFYSKLQNTISMVSNVLYDSARKVWQSQLQNVGSARFNGMEVAISYPFFQSLKAGMNYTFTERINLSNKSILFTDVPKHKIFGFIQYQLPRRITAQFNAEYNSDRYSTTYGTVAGSYMLLNTSATVHIWKWIAVEGGINNIADKNYELVEGYVEPGRNYFLNLQYRL